MAGPIPFRPLEPRWWVSVSGQTEGPFGQAYIVACLNAGQIPAYALLCLEGAQQWQPLSDWPQFNQFVQPQVQVSAGPAKPAVQVRATAPVPDEIKTAILYATAISPILFLVSNCLCLVGVTDDPFVLFLSAASFVLDGIARSVMLAGGMRMRNSPIEGTVLLKLGAWIMITAFILGCGVVLLFVVAAAGSPALQMEADSIPASNDHEWIAVIQLMISICELIYLFFMLSAIYRFRSRHVR